MVKMATSLVVWMTYQACCNLLLLKCMFAYATTRKKETCLFTKVSGNAEQALRHNNFMRSHGPSGSLQVCVRILVGRDSRKEKLCDSMYSLSCCFLSPNDYSTHQFIIFQYNIHIFKVSTVLFILYMHIYLISPGKKILYTNEFSFLSYTRALATKP